MDISVVVPVFNKFPDLKRSVESLRSQTRRHDEILFVDDGSTDGSLEYLQQLDWPDCRLLQRESPGPGGYAARNLAIRAATSEWVSFLDADDEWRPHYLASVHSAIETAGPEVGCVFTGYSFVNGDHVVEQRYGERSRGRGPHALTFEEFLDSWIADRDCPIWTGAVTFRRSVLLAAGLFPEGRCARGGDKDLWIRAMRQTTAVCLPESLATYRRDSVNMVTVRTGTGCTHCIQPTMDKIVKSSPPSIARKAKRVYNLEAYLYALRSSKGGHYSSKALAGFYWPQDVVRYGVALAAVSKPGLWLRRAVR